MKKEKQQKWRNKDLKWQETVNYADRNPQTPKKLIVQMFTISSGSSWF